MKNELNLDSTPTADMGEQSEEVPQETPAEPIQPKASVVSAPVTIGSLQPAKPQPKGNLVVNSSTLHGASVPSFSLADPEEKSGVSLGSGQKRKGITHRGLGGKKLGAATTVEPMAAAKPATETASKYGTSLSLEKKTTPTTLSFETISS